MKTQGVIFDLDGTMVDNMMVHHRAWQVKLRELGLDLSIEEVKERIHGVNEEILERLFGDRFNVEERRKHSSDKESRYREIFLPELRLIDGLDNFLSELSDSGTRMGIGTAAPPENLKFVLDNLDLHQYFHATFDASHVNKGKPDPEIFLKVAEGIGVDPENCVVFEDSPTGAEASWRAGCRTVIVTTTHHSREFSKFPNIVQFINNYREISVEKIL